MLFLKKIQSICKNNIQFKKLNDHYLFSSHILQTLNPSTRKDFINDSKKFIFSALIGTLYWGDYFSFGYHFYTSLLYITLEHNF